MRRKLVVLAVLMSLSAVSLAQGQLPPAVMQQLQKQVEIGDGDVLYVDFWASWCAPCRKSFPWMNQMHNKFAARGFKVVAINVDQERALADKFLHDVPVQFPVIYDREGKLAKQFKVKGMPSSYLIDSDGNIKSAHKGFFEKNTQQYEEEILSLLNVKRVVE